ncbi:juvenile hormone acid O-methyltransferase-like [Dermacentor variabilis]|uniref:juvenile hormone acid O-methyltransferase-like n=1 Tax=Dermacentor variabilis TaxID=34621 RepID=UPI003F5B5A82
MGTTRNSKNTSSCSFVDVESPVVFSTTLEEYGQCTVRILDCFQNAFAPTEVGADACVSELSEAKFIDVGCGEGSFTLKYLLPCSLSKCQKLVGVDKSSAMLEHARLRHGHDMIEYLHLDIVNSDVDKFVRQHGHFMRVYSFHLLHWDRDRARALKNIEKLIAPQGDCFIVFEHCIPVFEVFMAVAESPRCRK